MTPLGVSIGETKPKSQKSRTNTRQPNQHKFSKKATKPKLEKMELEDLEGNGGKKKKKGKGKRHLRGKDKGGSDAGDNE